MIDNKPCMKIKIDDKYVKVEIVDVVPKGYTYLQDFNGMALFVLKTMFAEQNQYVLCRKKTQNSTQKGWY